MREKGGNPVRYHDDIRCQVVSLRPICHTNIAIDIPNEKII